MTNEELKNYMDTVRTENNDAHKAIIQKFDDAEKRVTQVEKDVLNRPTFAQCKEIAKDRRGGLWSFLGGIVGGIVAFVTSIFVGGKQ